MLYDPPGETTVVVPTLNEGKSLDRTLKSLRAQDIVQRAPHRFEFMVVDSASTDNTQAVAEANHFLFYPGPMGKLSARDLAFELADGDVVFSADADTYYPPNTLNLMLRHFQDKNVVATYGPMILETPWLYRLGSSLQYYWQAQKLFGGNNAIRREAYFDAGRFDLSIDQKDRQAMIQEEEAGMYKKLLGIGDIIYEQDAVALASSRRSFDASFNQQVVNRLRFQTD